MINNHDKNRAEITRELIDAAVNAAQRERARMFRQLLAGVGRAILRLSDGLLRNTPLRSRPT